MYINYQCLHGHIYHVYQLSVSTWIQLSVSRWTQYNVTYPMSVELFWFYGFSWLLVTQFIELYYYLVVVFHCIWNILHVLSWIVVLMVIKNTIFRWIRQIFFFFGIYIFFFLNLIFSCSSWCMSCIGTGSQTSSDTI